VIAQESLDYGWHEAIVLDRKGDTFILQYRDFPHPPRFARQRPGVALMCSADNEESWNEIASGHLVIAQESAEDGWWEAIVIDRKADMLMVQFRDYSQPKIVRHRSAIALTYRANEGRAGQEAEVLKYAMLLLLLAWPAAAHASRTVLRQLKRRISK
jgi:hypothetical protein